ncbi:HAD family hydrolase, partial [Salmonella enterica]|nr:HAD family hydrolase [Salmonella enterica]
RGALIKGGAALEQLGRITQVAFDKTGTLTIGKPRVTAIHPASGISEAELLALAAAVEQGATHPLAQAIIREAQTRDLAIPTAESQRTLAGTGIEAQVNGERILICAAGKQPA